MVHRRGGKGVRLHRSGDRSVHAEGRLLLTHSVVIVSYRPTDRLARCLESVLAQTGDVGEIDIVVVDNGSPGESASRIAESYGARAVRLPDNVGFPAGANAGAKKATGDVVGFLNDDAQAGEGWIVSASSALEDATVAAVGPKVVLTGRYLEVVMDDETRWVPGDARRLGRRLFSAALSGRDVLSYLVGPGIHRLESASEPDAAARCEPSRWRWTTGRNASFYVPLPPGDDPVELVLNGEQVRPARVVDLLNSVGSYLREDGYVGDIGADVPDDEEFDIWEERFALTGAAMVTTKDVLSKVGCFEPRYFAYYEDTDWCWRAQLQGYRLLFDPTVTVRHERGATSGGVLSRRVHFLLERNRLLTLLRNAPMGLAARETWKKRCGGGTDGVAEMVPRFVPRALAERALLSQAWALGPSEVAERWAGVDVPGDA
ncbi:MAG: glycosyltransferase family 2 protein [Acidimicrobiales bacterium]